ncbi:MAG: Na/Pi cotransporter family protein [Synergistaceae bacterium]|jgi:phosphate:Na+ symporter|nr:Na/Pi cotransporter family protein [Synergistaceae bacterium]
MDLLKLLGGVALLIYGIKTMGDALQDLAGDNLRRLLASLTGTPARGVAAGAVVTMIIQSSSATTVMLVSFVHVGLMNLSQAFSVIMGANIGTTITAQLIAFSIQKYSILAAIAGVVLAIFGKSSRQRQAGTGMVGFALLFVGMGMMQDAMSFLKGRADIFISLNNNPLLGLAMGTVVTMAIQASSATVGLTMVMASQGILSLDTSVAIILGDNIGTTITAVLASLGGNRAAKQTATAHVMFNVIGATIMMAALPYFTKLVTLSSDDVARQVANAHSMFNILNTIIFLPFIKPYTALIKWILPDDPNASNASGAIYNARFLDSHFVEVSPAAGVDAVRKEMVRLGDIALGMLKECYRIILERDAKAIPDVFMTEKAINHLTHDIIKYATEVGQKVHTPDLSLLLNSCVSGVSDMERIGDHGENIVEMAQLMAEKKLKFSHKANNECREMFDLVIDAVEKSIRAIDSEDPNLTDEVLALETRIDKMEKVLRARHIARLNSGKCLPDVGILFIEILSNLERVGDHAHNIALIVKDIQSVHHRQAAK